MVNIVRRAYKYRFYPTDAQADELLRVFGCVRMVYNRALEARSAAWRTEQRHVTYGQTSAMLTAWKRTEDLAFLNEVSSVPLQQALRHLQAAYDAFFARRAGHPRFKSRKRSRAAAEYTRSAFRFRDGQLMLSKVSGPLEIRWSRPLPCDAEPTTVTVSRDPADRWFVSLLVEDPTVEPLPQAASEVGVDLGISSLTALSTGEKIPNPRHERRDRQRLGRAQRAMSRKAKGSRNREKARRRVARIYVRISDRRRDHLHKLSTRLVRENQAIMLEDLNVQGMLGNHTLASAISDAAWRQLRIMLEYKCAWYGRELVVVDRWLASSKLCSVCGQLGETLPLNVRKWNCDTCGSLHDRDVNAARNILAAGRAAAACGGDVSPQRESLPGGAVASEAGTSTGDRGATVYNGRRRQARTRIRGSSRA